MSRENLLEYMFLLYSPKIRLRKDKFSRQHFKKISQTLPNLPQFSVNVKKLETYRLLIYLFWTKHQYVTSIKSLMDLFITSVSLIQIFTIYISVYLTVSSLQHWLKWWVHDKLLLLHLLGLVLLWLYITGINTTTQFDYCSPKKFFLIC